LRIAKRLIPIFGDKGAPDGWAEWAETQKLDGRGSHDAYHKDIPVYCPVFAADPDELPHNGVS
jgi:hypothetical protein